MTRLDELFTTNYTLITNIINKYYNYKCNYKEDIIQDIYLLMRELPQDKITHLIDTNKFIQYITGIVIRSVNDRNKLHLHYTNTYHSIDDLHLSNDDTEDSTEIEYTREQIETVRILLEFEREYKQVFKYLMKFKYSSEQLIEIYDTIKTNRYINNKDLLEYIRLLNRNKRNIVYYLQFKSTVDLFNKYKLHLPLKHQIILADYYLNSKSLRQMDYEYGVRYTTIHNIIQEGLQIIFNRHEER